MKQGDSVDKKINEFIDGLSKKNKKRFEIKDLEDYVINRFKGNREYLEKGGYPRFVESINKLKELNIIRDINSSDYNGLNPPLKIRWERIEEVIDIKWDKSKMMKFSDLLDFTYYANNPIHQTEIEWEYIENIYGFLKFRENREWGSIEERSLELFYDEKYLTERKQTLKGKYGILHRLKISYEDLKMKKYGEMFVYWNRGTHDIKKVIILENHSTFFSYKRMAEKGNTIYGFRPDIIIYGGGNKIENSFSFIEEIADIENIEVRYFGDIDSEGFGIYKRLKDRYKDVDISLQREAYRDLIDLCSREYKRISSSRNEIYLKSFLDEMEEFLDTDKVEKLLDIWNRNLRVPQELINYEYLMDVIG